MAADCEGSEPGPVAEIAVGEEGERVKPFTPEKAREIVMSLQQPAVFCNMVFDWPARHWTAEHLSEVLWGKQIRFRMGLRSTDTVPQFETSCSYVDATLEEFLTWNRNQSSTSGPFKDYDHSKFWAYADYKYFVTLFEDKTDVFQEVVWSDFGFPGRNGQESTLWIGSLGAHTPCHLDSYGCNLVFQVQGRKRWHLFPPEDTPFLYPTRIPYEESSVFSKINVVNPDLKRFPQFRKAQRHTVTLSPGQVLFVPRHWWHYVESIDPVTVSINSWIELEEDHLARVEEAIARMLVCALKTAEGPHYPGAWLNPTEVEETSHEVNCCYLNGAVCAFFDHCKKAKEVEMQTVRANGEREEPSVQEHTEVEHDQSVTVESPHDQSVTVESPPHDQSVTVESPHDQSVTVESPHDQSVTVESPLHDQSVTVESPHDQSITVESPHDQSITVESPHDQSVTVESPHDQSVTVESPHDQSITVESPHDQSITVESPHDQSVTVESPHDQSVTVESPHDQSITVESPHDQSITVESPHDQSITVESPHDQSITVESPHDQSVTVESQDRSVTIESPHDQSVTVESPYDQSVTVGSPQDQSVTVKSGRQEAASLFSPNLVPVTPASEEGGGTLEGDSKECIKRKRDRELTAELPCAKRQQTSQGESAVAEQVASGRPMAPSRILVSTDDLLDCLVNPQVTKMVAQLLIQRKSL